MFLPDPLHLGLYLPSAQSKCSKLACCTAWARPRDASSAAVMVLEQRCKP